MNESEQITELLQAWQSGKHGAQDELFNFVYSELRRIANSRLRGESSRQSLQATELVHEVFPQLARQKQKWQNRSHFFALASECMRRYLVDYARTRRRQKRGGDAYQVEFSDVKPHELWRIENFDEIIAVDRVMTKLSALNATQAEIIKHRYFGGLSREEIAELLEISPSSVDRSYKIAKAWLRRELAFEFSPHLLHVSQINNPTKFIAQFRAASTNTFAQSLRPALPATMLAEIEKTNDSNAAETLFDLIETLNKMLLGNKSLTKTQIETQLIPRQNHDR